jgi:hypothetical protein
MQKCSDTGERVRPFVSNYKICLNYQSWYLFLRTAHSYSCSCHSNCSQHYAVGPATVALLPTCWHLVPSQLQTPYQCSHFLLISAGFVKTLLHLSCLLLKVIDPPNYVAMSVSSRGVPVFMFCTWQHWISIAPLSTLCRLTVHSRSAHGPLTVRENILALKRILRYWTCLRRDRLIDHFHSKLKRIFLTGTLLSL